MPIEALQDYLVDVPNPGCVPPDSPLLAPAPLIDWRALFGNNHPIEIEGKSELGIVEIIHKLGRKDLPSWCSSHRSVPHIVRVGG